MDTGQAEHLASLNCGMLRITGRRITAVNTALATWRGLPGEDLAHQGLDRLFVPASILYWENAVEPLLEHQGHAWDLALRLRSEADGPVDVLVNARRQGPDTECLMFPYAARRLQQRRLREAEAHAARQKAEVERLERIENFRRDFINAVAHELATPITPIQLQVYLLKKAVAGRVDPQLQDEIVAMEANVNRLSGLLDAIVAAADVEAGRIAVRPSSLRLDETLPEMVDTWRRHHAPGRSIQVKVQDLAVRADADALRTCLANLLDNAVKFSPPGSPVRVRVEDGERAKIVVEDIGRGIAQDRLERLGRPFVQGHDRDEYTEPGAGLGLHLVAGLMKAQGGSLRVRSEGRGRGTRAILELPRAPVGGAGDAGPHPT